MGLFTRFKAAGRGFTKGYKQQTSAEVFRVAGRQVACPHCENTLFLKYTLGVHEYFPLLPETSRGRPVTCLVCANCSRIQWFADDIDGTPPNT